MPFSRLLAVLAVAIAASPVTAAQQPSAPQQPQTVQDLVKMTEAQKSAIPKLRGAVVYLEVQGADNFGTLSGTGFFVKLRDSQFAVPRGVYLVTNRHVAQPGIELGTPHNAVDVLISSNLWPPEKGSTTEHIQLQGPTHWYFPQDESVDLAVMPLWPSGPKYDIRPIESTIFATKEQIDANAIEVGDPVLFTGLFTSRPGAPRLEPIVRQGIIAMMPNQPMNTTLNKQGLLYLADAHAFHGNSGSPMFINVGAVHHGAIIAEDRYLLLGVVSGYFPEKEGYIVPAATVLTGEVHDNSGIASVVPAAEVLKLIKSTQAKLEADVSKATKKP